MQINLEIYLHDMSGDPLANVVCNAVPREGDRLRLIAGDDAPSGLYRVLGYTEHLLDPRLTEVLQHVCVIVMREKE